MECRKVAEEEKKRGQQISRLFNSDDQPPNSTHTALGLVLKGNPSILVRVYTTD
jgi:hypothetical protein